jgi:transposase InsO family protein
LEAEGVGLEDELIIRSDNGPQMRSNEFHKYLEKLEHRLAHEFIPVQTPNKNAHVESFFSILEAEFIQVRYFKTFAEAYSQTHAWVKFYNTSRIHGSLGMRAPAEVLEIWRRGEHLEIKDVRL